MQENIKFLLSNCRSVILKTDSVLDMFENCCIDFAILTETWTNEKNQTYIKEDFQKGKGLEIILSSRERKRGGGLAIVYKKDKLSFKRHECFSGGFEILIVKCKVEVTKKALFVIATYYPPNMKVGEVRDMNEIICDEILKIKMENEDPFIMIAGDMNKKNCDVFVTDFPDIKLIDSPPTRRNEKLDLCFSNCNINKCDRVSPVWSNDGPESDHCSLCFNICFEGPKFTYETKISRKITKVGEQRFCQMIREETWESVFAAEKIGEKVTELHRLVEKYKDMCFPFKKSRIRSDEDPWISDHIRRMIKQRNRAFFRVGRTQPWKDLRDNVRLQMEQAKCAYYDREVEKICNSKDKRSLAYTALKNINCAEKAKSWKVQDMCREEDEQSILERLADFFNGVTCDYKGAVREDLIQTYDRPLYNLTVDMVEKRILSAKKPNSQVPGDFPPQLLTELASSIAGVMTDIFNRFPKDMIWPEEWRKEFQTVIPKKSPPENFDQLRNLSCTNFLSKIMESFVIDSIKSEISLSDLQYGGLKGCGTDNFFNRALEQHP